MNLHLVDVLVIEASITATITIGISARCVEQRIALIERNLARRARADDGR